MINTVLFDLDGTLLAMDTDEFVKLYYQGIVKKFIPHGYQKDIILNAVYEGVKAMLKNDGKKTNEEVFWDRFTYFLPDNFYFFERTFLDFYENEFQEIKKITKTNPYAIKAINELKRKNYNLVVATNPLFPAIATKSRMAWADLAFTDFDLVTTIENSSYSKPNIHYYQEILQKINRSANECLMVGNDISEDMIVSSLGMDTFLITDNLINPKNEDISKFKSGSFEDFYAYIEKLPALEK